MPNFPTTIRQQHDAEQRKIVDDYGGNDERAERDEKHGNKGVAQRQELGVSFMQVVRAADGDAGEKSA